MSKHVLFVCTGNAGRSQLAAAFFSRLAGRNVVVSSAGVAPWPHLHPEAIKLLRSAGFATDTLHPKSVLSVANERFDIVVTMGHRALAELPTLAGRPLCLHWDIGDPADADGTGQEATAFREALAQIEARLPELLARISPLPGRAARLV